jgi:hypothetical protein
VVRELERVEFDRLSVLSQLRERRGQHVGMTIAGKDGLATVELCE